MSIFGTIGARRAGALSALALGLGLAGPALAIDGGAPAGRDALAQATVAIGTITRPEEALQLTRCSGVLWS